MFYYFSVLLVRILGKFVPSPTSQNDASFLQFPDFLTHLYKYKFKQYSDTVLKRPHNVWTLCFICGEKYDLQWQTGILHEEFKSVTSFRTVMVLNQFNSLVNQKIINTLHNPSIKHAPYISYHQCFIFSNHLQYITQLILKSSLWDRTRYGPYASFISCIRFDRQAEVLRYESKSFISFKTAIVICQFNSLGQN